MKQILSLLVIATLLLSSISIPPCSAQENAPSSPLSTTAETPKPQPQDAPGELMIADVLLMRPLGFAACIIGLVGAVVAYPFALITNSQDTVCRALVEKPFRYTFQRPVGQMEWE
jgi:hypothetical protein